MGEKARSFARRQHPFLSWPSRFTRRTLLGRSEK